MVANFFLISVILYVVASQDGQWWSINSEFQLKSGRDTSSLAWAYYENSVNQTGWAILSINTNPSASNIDQARAAGYLEGYLTSDLIWMSWQPSLQVMFPNGEINSAVNYFFTTNLAWMTSMAQQNSAINPYWEQVNLIIAQLNGITQGQNDAADSTSKLSLLDIFILNTNGDVDTLVQMFYNDIGPSEFKSHCSVLIKILNDFSDLYSGHTTWGDYPTMLRIYKTYNINFNNTKSKTQIFSSYPAYISSATISTLQIKNS